MPYAGLRPGQPGITPYLNADDPDLPTYTGRDAQEYVLHHKLVRFGEYGYYEIIKDIRIEEGEFTKDHEGPVCQVSVWGPFNMARSSGDPNPSYPDGSPIIIERLIHVFDARTGNDCYMLQVQAKHPPYV